MECREHFVFGREILVSTADEAASLASQLSVSDVSELSDLQLL